jgi:hypothetical protein
MGYDVRLLRGIDWQARRQRTAMEMLEENFSDDPNSDVFYGSTGRTPSNSSADGFVPLTDQVMRWLEFPARARTGIYDSMSLDELDQHCALKNTQDLAVGYPKGRYDEIRTWMLQELTSYISLVEQADWRFQNPGQATEPDRTPASPPAEVITFSSSENEDDDPPPRDQQQ